MDDRKTGLKWTFSETLEDLDFADDMVLYNVVETVRDAYSIQKDLDLIPNWSDWTGMVSNALKTTTKWPITHP